FLDSPTERRARKRRCIAGGYLEGMPIPARSMPTRVGAESLSTGTSTELDTHGREAALRAPPLIREDRTQRGKCCGSSLGIRSHRSEVRVSPVETDISREADLTAPPLLATAIEVVSKLPAVTAASLHPQVFRGLLTAVVNDVEVNHGTFNEAVESW